VSLPAALAEKVDALDREAYASLVTFRRDGTPVRTPVWFARMPDGRFGIFTLRETYKVKRLSRDPRVQLAACSLRGRVHGEWFTGTGEIGAGAQADELVYAALGRKYRWRWWFTRFFGRLTGRARRWATIAVTLTGTGAERPL
jgi:hypothetical protein